jgi:hypothetical protein
MRRNAPQGGLQGDAPRAAAAPDHAAAPDLDRRPPRVQGAPRATARALGRVRQQPQATSPVQAGARKGALQGATPGLEPPAPAKHPRGLENRSPARPRAPAPPPTPRATFAHRIAAGTRRGPCSRTGGTRRNPGRRVPQPAWAALGPAGRGRARRASARVAQRAPPHPRVKSRSTERPQRPRPAIPSRGGAHAASAARARGQGPERRRGAPRNAPGVARAAKACRPRLGAQHPCRRSPAAAGNIGVKLTRPALAASARESRRTRSAAPWCSAATCEHAAGPELLSRRFIARDRSSKAALPRRGAGPCPLPSRPGRARSVSRGAGRGKP